MKGFLEVISSLAIILIVGLSMAMVGSQTTNISESTQVADLANCSDLRQCVESCANIENCSMYLNCLDNCTINATFGASKGYLPYTSAGRISSIGGLDRGVYEHPPSYGAMSSEEGISSVGGQYSGSAGYAR